MESKKNKAGFIIFLFILILVVVGGYFGMRYIINNDFSKEKKELITKETDNRLNKEKDFVYYENVNRILSYLEIDYEDVYVNLKSAETINQSLNNEVADIRKSAIYVKDHPLEEGVEYTENEEGIYSLKYREYEDYKYQNYISLVVKDYNYDISIGSIPTKTKSYIFNKEEDILLNEEQILNKYQLSLVDIKNNIKKKLNAEQQTVDDVPLIKVDETLDKLNYSLFINRIGKLEICYLVESTKLNYYDSIVLS